MLSQVGSGCFGATWGDYNGENFIGVTEATGLANIEAGRAAWADVDGDSVPDLLICSLGETQSCRLFRNLNVDQANWAKSGWIPRAATLMAMARKFTCTAMGKISCASLAHLLTTLKATCPSGWVWVRRQRQI